MNQYIIGKTIKQLRRKNNMTQLQLSERLMVSDKSVSKWETGKGYPDITMLEKIADAFSISVSELIQGSTVVNENKSSHMPRSKFYVCPVCGNVIFGVGESVICCHGITLSPLESKCCDNEHCISTEAVEDELFVTIKHPMTKQHYITFIGAISSDRVQIVKLYPEGSSEVRFKMEGIKKLCFYCNKDGFFTK